MPLSSLCMQNKGQGLGPADEASRHSRWSLSNHCTPLLKLRATQTSGKRKLPALCVSLQPVIKQLGGFSNMSVLKYLFYSSYFIPMKRSGHCSVGHVKAQVPLPFLPHPNCCLRAPPPILLLHPQYPQPPDAISSFFPPNQLCAKTEISGGDAGQGWTHCHSVMAAELG